MMTGTPPPSWTRSHRALCAFAATILIAPFLVVHLFDGQQVDEKPFTTLRPIATHKRQLRLQPSNSATSTTTDLIGDVSTTTADQNEDGGSLIRRGLGGIAERVLDHLWDPWWGGRQRRRRRRRRRKPKGRGPQGRKKKRCNRRCRQKKKRKNKKRKKKPKSKKSQDDPPFPPPPSPSPPFTQLPEQECRVRSTDVIVQTLTLPTANVFSRSSPAEVTKALGNLYHQTALWDTYCATYEIVSRRMTSTNEERRTQQANSITITVYVFGIPSQPNAVQLLTSSSARSAIQEALRTQLGVNNVTISSITVVNDNLVQVSVRPIQRRLRRASATSKRSKHTKSAHKDNDDEIEAANEEWRDMNIAALHHVVSDQPTPTNNAKVNDDNDDKKSLPYLSSQRSDFDILPFVCVSDLSVKANAISIATQTDSSPNRLDRLVQMAERWDGYISVAIYGKKDEENDFRNKVEAFWHDHSKDLKDKVIVHLVIDGRQEEEGYDDMHYPHNILRNVAMEHTPTDLVFYNDVDFIPSVDSHAMLLKHLSSMPQDRPSVMILPAFERKLFEGEVESEIIAQDVPFSKANLLSQLDTNFERIAPFHENYASGHGPTDYAKWYRAAEPYQVEYDLDYEPYFVVDKTKWDVPLFWEHFTGFGKNKQSWVEELAVAGFRFYVCPDAFIVHVDHSVDDQDERIMRPSIIDEYGVNFQSHLIEKYGRKIWADDDLAEWTHDNIRAFAMNMLRAE